MGPEHEEYDEICRALEEVSAAALYNNEAIRAKDDQFNQMKEMIDIVQKTKIDVLDKPRVLLKQGAFPCLRFGKQETLNFYLFNDQILVGKLGGRRDTPAFSRIDLNLIQVHGNYELSVKSNEVPRPPSIGHQNRDNSSASKSDKSDNFGVNNLAYDSDNSTSSKLDKKTNAFVFQSPRESFIIFAR